MTSQSVKIRSLILSALMVFSVFAGTIALSGSAAAAGNVTGTPAAVNDVTHYEDSANNPVLEIAFSEDIDPNSINETTDIYVTLDDGTTVQAYGTQGDDTAGAGGFNGDFGTSGAGDRAVTGASERILFDTNVVYNTVSNVTINGIRDQNGEDLVANRTVEVTFAPSTVDTTAATDTETEAYRGANVSIVDGLNNLDTDFDIEGQSDLTLDIQRGTGPNSEVYAFDTDGRELGSYSVIGTNNVTLTIEDLGLSVSTDESSFDDNENITGTVETNAIDRNVDVELVDDDGDTVEETTVDVGSDGEANYNFSQQDAGNYSVNATDVNTQVTATSGTFDVVDVGDEEASFAASTYEEAQGDILNVTILYSNTDTATVQFGDYSDDNYNISAEVVDDDGDGEAYVEFNTFTAGTADNGNTVLSTGDSDTNINNVTEVSQTAADNQWDDMDANQLGENLIDPADYDILVRAGEKDANAISDEDSVATFTLSDRSTDSANVWTAPEDDYDNLAGTDADGVTEFVNAGNLTQTSTIANSDTMVVSVTANGLEGALDVSDYQSLSGTGNFFSLVIEEESDNANADPATANISSLSTDNVSVIYDDTEGSGADTHYVVINTDNLTDQNNFDYEDGDSYVANFTVWDEGSGTEAPANGGIAGDQYYDHELADSNETVQDSVTVEDAEVDLDTNADDFVVLEARNGTEVTGDTNLAPGTELTIRLRSDGAPVPFLKQPETIVQSDGTFTATANFSSENEGGNFTAQPRVGATNIGSSYDGYLVAGDAPTTTEDTTTEAGTTDEPATPPETDTQTDEPTEETTTMGDMDGTETATMADDDGTAAEETTTGSGGPGFTAAIALIALVAAALLAVRRNN